MTEANSEMIPKQNQDILKHAWKLFAVYDKNAIIQQSLYKKFQFAILLLGIIVTILSLASATLSPQQFTQTNTNNNNNNDTSSSGQTTQLNNNNTIESTSELFLRYVIIILPIS